MALVAEGSRKTGQAPRPEILRRPGCGPCWHTKDPQGLSNSEVKRPNGLSMIPWEPGKPLSWDVTVYPLDDSYISAAVCKLVHAAEENSSVPSLIIMR